MRSFRYYLLLATLSGFALAQAPAPPDSDAPPDEPGRQVARLSVLNGDAQIRRGDTGDWVAAAVNTPLMMGDSLAVGNGRAEIQFDSTTFVRVAAETEVRLWDLEDRRLQIQVAHGMVTWRVLRDGGPVSEISTPMAAVRPAGVGAVRVEVAPEGTTHVTPHHGEADVSSPRGDERVREGNMLSVEGQADNPYFRTLAAPPSDGWDQFNDQRDGLLTRAQSPRYVSPDIYGTEDLDQYGRWMTDPTYGSVWSPNVPASWAPYRDGRWVWTDYYGWTWVDDAPWGWAPFHYGNWYYRVGFGWCWFPGARERHYFYRPALVAFFGTGGGVGIGFSNVGWVPLAPYEVYRPWYGRGFYGGRTTVINNVTIVNNTNVYNSFRNARAFNGVTAVSATDFQSGNYRHPVSLGAGQLTSASLVHGAPLTPTQNNFRFSDRQMPQIRSNANAQTNQHFFTRMGGPRNEPSRGQMTPAPAPQQNAPANNAPAWQHFGSPAVQPRNGEQQQNRPQLGSPDRPLGFGGGRREAPPQQQQPAPLQVAPPVVQQREQPRQERRNPSFGAPMPQQQPQPQNRPAPQMNRPEMRPAPQQQQRGGGERGGDHGRGNGNGNGNGRGNR
jgi:hypothetical protein